MKIQLIKQITEIYIYPNNQKVMENRETRRKDGTASNKRGEREG